MPPKQQPRKSRNLVKSILTFIGVLVVVIIIIYGVLLIVALKSGLLVPLN